MKFDFASIVDREFSKLVWAGNERVNQKMDAEEQKRVASQQRRKYVVFGFFLVIYLIAILHALE